MRRFSRWGLGVASGVGLVVTAAAQTVTPGPESFAMRVVTSGLSAPWQMRAAPDGSVWVTERVAGRVLRVDPRDGSLATLIAVAESVQHHAQDGLLGLALPRNFLRTPSARSVYLSFTYDADPGPAEVRRLKVRRYTYDPVRLTLDAPVDLIENLPAGDDHIAGRLVYGTDDTLYLSLGDQGFNQFGLSCAPIRAHELPTAADVAARHWPEIYQGKVLRINLDGSIPADNPTIRGVRSHVYSYGHRNPQGLAMTADGAIYESEHGPSMDDEVNRIRPGRHYGWPFVAGHQDDRVYVYANWSQSAPTPCASLPFDPVIAPPSVPQQPERAWRDPAFAPPIQTFFTVGPDYRFDTSGNATIAPSGIDVYDARPSVIPGWTRSVLVTSLLRGVVFRVKLNAAGDRPVGEPLAYFKTESRYRDVLVGADGRTIYVATDATSRAHPGAILEFTYQP